MDTPEKPGRRWWRKKRWWAAGALWLAVAYLLSIGPAFYLAVHGWLSEPTFQAVYAPPLYLLDSAPSRAVGYDDYVAWWWDHTVLVEPERGWLGQ